MDSCGIAHSGQQRARRLEPEVNLSQPEPAPRNFDLRSSSKRCRAPVYGEYKRTHVWAWVDGCEEGGSPVRGAVKNRRLEAIGRHCSTGYSAA